MTGLQLLLLEDNPLDATVIQATLQEGGIASSILRVETRAEFVQALETQTFDLILADYSLLGFDGLAALGIAQSRCSNTPFIFVSASMGEELVIEALKQGATDYVLKQRLGRLVPCVQRALREAEEKQRRQQAEAALAQSESRLRQVAANLPRGAVFIVDRELRYRLAEGEALIQVGMTPDNFIGKTLWEALGPDLAAEYEPYYRQALSGEPFVLEHSTRNHYYISHGTPLRSESGEVEAVLAMSYDITDRKQAETALSQSEARLRLMMASAKEYAIFTVDAAGLITSWSAGAECLFDHSEAEILGTDSRRLYTPEDNLPGEGVLDRVSRELQTAQTQGQAENECWHVRKDGSRFWGSGFVMPLRDEANHVQGFIKILRDVTAQRQADERFRLLYDLTSDLLVVEQPMTLMHNLFHKLSAQLGLDYACQYIVTEKDGRPMLRLQNAEGLDPAVQQTIEWVELGEDLCGEVAETRRQLVLDQDQIAAHAFAPALGNLTATAYVCQPLIVQDRLLGTLSFASRSRSQFTAEEVGLLQLMAEQVAIALDRANLLVSIQQHAEQLQRANQLKDEFLAVLSHELRSPLNPILGWARLLQTGKLDTNRQREALATIERNAKLQSQLIEDLLDISRIIQGKLSLSVGPVQLATVVQAALETVRLAAEAKSIQIKVNLAFPGQVMGDATRLQQVVWNLLSNAVKFTPVGGQVEVWLEGSRADGADGEAFARPDCRAWDVEGDSPEALPTPVHVASESTGQPRQTTESLSLQGEAYTPHPTPHLQLTIRDNGKGITPSFLPHVFDYFRQEDGATTRRFGGLGLGLAIVRQIVGLHGGTIWAESQGEGLGATFTVRLPLMPVSATVDADSPTASPMQDLQGIQVLVIDDEADSREFVAFVLEQAGAQVTMAASAYEGFWTLAQSPPDVLISDIGMPDMDGYMFMQQVRALPPDQGGQVQAIALTAYAGDFNQAQALQAGFQRHVSKPVEPEALVQAIANLSRVAQN